MKTKDGLELWSWVEPKEPKEPECIDSDPAEDTILVGDRARAQPNMQVEVTLNGETHICASLSSAAQLCQVNIKTIRYWVNTGIMRSSPAGDWLASQLPTTRFEAIQKWVGSLNANRIVVAPVTGPYELPTSWVTLLMRKTGRLYKIDLNSGAILKRLNNGSWKAVNLHLRDYSDPTGYMKVKLAYLPSADNSAYKWVYVHQLVAYAYAGRVPPPALLEYAELRDFPDDVPINTLPLEALLQKSHVDHINGDRQDNNYKNLEIVPPSVNERRKATRLKGYVGLTGNDGKVYHKYASLIEASEKTGIPYDTLRGAVSTYKWVQYEGRKFLVRRQPQG